MLILSLFLAITWPWERLPWRSRSHLCMAIYKALWLTTSYRCEYKQSWIKRVGILGLYKFILALLSKSPNLFNSLFSPFPVCRGRYLKYLLQRVMARNEYQSLMMKSLIKERRSQTQATPSWLCSSKEKLKHWRVFQFWSQTNTFSIFKIFFQFMLGSFHIYTVTVLGAN